MLTTQKVEFIDEKKFAKMALDENIETFVIHVALLISKIIIHLAEKVQIAFFVTKKITIPAEYLDYPNIFPKK